MPALLKERAFDPDEIAIMATAFEEALRELHLTDREDLATLMVAERIIDAARPRPRLEQPGRARLDKS